MTVERDRTVKPSRCYSPKKWDKEDAEANYEPPVVVVERVGARRPKIRIAGSLRPLLTDRQRDKLNGKVRLGKAFGRMMQIMEEQNLTIEEFVRELSNEELARGQLKDKNGRFTGTPPKWVPQAFYQACVNELMERGKRVWQENYVDAVTTLADIAMGRVPGCKPGDRLKASLAIVERLEGRVPDKLLVSTDAPWQVAIQDIVADVSDDQVDKAKRLLGRGEVVEGEVVDAVIVDEEPTSHRASPQPRRRRR